MIRRLRAVKSFFETSLMRKAGEIGKQVYHRAREFLKEGMTEIEFGGLLEAAAKSARGAVRFLHVKILIHESTLTCSSVFLNLASFL